jgi:hypothetical protein
MGDLVTLRCPPGAADAAISYGTQNFPAYRADHMDPMSPWYVDVTREASAGFLHQGGFSMVMNVPAVPYGFMLIRHGTDPKATHSMGHPVGHGWMVSIEVGNALVAHGFEPVATEEELEGPHPAEFAPRPSELEVALARIVELEEAVALATAGAKKVREPKGA